MTTTATATAGALATTGRKPGRKISMLLKILVVLALLLVVFLIIVALQKADYRVSRSATIAAPPSAVFAEVDDVRRMQAWNPWVKLDPNLKPGFEGPPAGVGAVYTWSGNSSVGQGRQTITESRPNEFIRMQLDFIKPFPGTSYAEFTFKREGDQTLVTWSIEGKKSFIPKAVGLFMDMDKMIGEQFEKGLADLKSLAERPATR